MKHAIFALLVPVLLTSCGFQGSTDEAQEASIVEVEDSDKIVVELFTSQGCSSCPPADQYLSEIIDENEDVIALAFHVDYWNRLGWKDPYSSPKFSERQRSYSRKLVAQTYTPQMIVNGRYEFVGSKRSSGAEVLEKASENKQPVKIELAGLEINGAKLQFHLSLQGGSNDQVINIVVVESGLSDEIPRGENAGKTLKHDNVVRVYKQINAKEAHGLHSLVLPDGVDPKRAQLIAYTQNEKWEVTGVHESALQD